MAQKLTRGLSYFSGLTWTYFLVARQSPNPSKLFNAAETNHKISILLILLAQISSEQKVLNS